MIAAERAAPEGAIAVEELTDRAAIGALFSEWERLRAEVAAKGGTRGPFLSPTWLSIFAASLAGEKSGRRLRLLIAHRQGRLAGVLPMMAERRRIAGVPARVLRSLSDDHSDRFDALLDGEQAARAIFEHLARDRSWDLLELREAPVAAGAGIDLIVEVARARGQLLAEWPSLASPYLPLPSSVAELEGTTRRTRDPSYPWQLILHPEGTAMDKVYASAKAALDGLLFDDMTIAAGGFGLCGIPENLIGGLLQADRKSVV